jgi:hypothetical protein
MFDLQNHLRNSDEYEIWSSDGGEDVNVGLLGSNAENDGVVGKYNFGPC